MADTAIKRPSRAVTALGFVLGAPAAVLWFTLAANEYVLPSWGRYLAVALAVLIGVSFRLVAKRPGHLLTWLLVLLGGYNLHLGLSGYLYLYWWGPPIIALVGLGFYFLFRRREKIWRILNAIHAVLFVGLILFSMHNQYYFVNENRRCENELLRLPAFVQQIAGPPRHPYDLAAAPGAPFAGVAFGKTNQVYLLRLSDLTLLRGSEIQTGVQRVTPHPREPLLAMPAWAHWGHDESVYLVDASTGSVRERVPVPGCRNVFDVEFARDRMYVLCEVSHSLHELADSSPHQTLRTLVLPGMDSYDFAIDVAGERAYVSDWLSPYLDEVDLRTMQLVRRKWIGWVSFGVAFGPDGLLYVAQPLHRRVQVLDASRMEIVRSIPVGYGARDLAFDPRRRLLFVGNYFDGTLDVVRLADGGRVRRIFAGDLLRGLWFDDAHDRLFLAVGCGVRVAEMNALLAATAR